MIVKTDTRETQVIDYNQFDPLKNYKNHVILNR